MEPRFWANGTKTRGRGKSRKEVTRYRAYLMNLEHRVPAVVKRFVLDRFRKISASFRVEYSFNFFLDLQTRYTRQDYNQVV